MKYILTRETFLHPEFVDGQGRNVVKLKFPPYLFQVTEDYSIIELFIRNETAANGEYEMVKRPIIKDIPRYKIVMHGDKKSVEILGDQELQLNLFNIRSYRVGCGSLLIDSFIKWAKWRNHKVIWLDVLKENTRAQNLYLRYKFKMDDEFNKLKPTLNYYRMYLIINE